MIRAANRWRSSAKRRLGCEARDALIGTVPDRCLRRRRESARRRGGVPCVGRRGASQRVGGAGDADARAARAVPRAASAGTWSATDGIAALTDALAAPLGAALRLRTRVVSIALRGRRAPRRDRGRRGLGADPRPAVWSWRHRRATPPRCSPASTPEAAKRLASIDYAPVASVTFSIAQRRDARTAARIRLSGAARRGRRAARLPVPEPALRRARAAGSRAAHAARRRQAASPRRWRGPTTSSSPRSARELDRVLGLRESPRLLAITRWPRAVPQPGRDHVRLVAARARRSRALSATRARGRASRRRRVRRGARVGCARRTAADGGTMSKPDCIFCKIIAGQASAMKVTETRGRARLHGSVSRVAGSRLVIPKLARREPLRVDARRRSRPSTCSRDAWPGRSSARSRPMG